MSAVPPPLKQVVIVGGGSAGWMTAAALANAVGRGTAITLIESEAIGTVGVGEATIPPVRRFNQSLGIDERAFIAATKATFKLGIEFVNWGRLGDRYPHLFGSYGADFDSVRLFQYWLRAHLDGAPEPLEAHSMAWAAARRNRFAPPIADPRRIQSTYDYAYHFDAGLYAQFLRAYAEERGVTRVEGTIVDVAMGTGFAARDADTHVHAVTLADGRTIAGDLFVDCSGFGGLLIEGALKAGYEDWTHWLPCDRAVAVPSENAGPLTPYTRATARSAGWQWRIPLQHRMGNGYVYSSAHLGDDEAATTLLDNLDAPPLADPRLLRFTTGRRRRAWVGNVVAIGLSSGFLEPLESTSLHLIQTGVTRLIALWPRRDCDALSRDEYNRLTAEEYERIRDFIILHYHATQRNDAPLWRHVAAMAVPDSLRWKMDHFRQYGRVVARGHELFSNDAWTAVMIGQNIIPAAAEPIIDTRSHVDGPKMLSGIRRVIDEVADAMPDHHDFITQLLARA